MVLQLPADFPIPVVLVIHRSRKFKSSLEELLHRRAKLSVKLADDKEAMEKGCVYFAPSDYHLLLEPEGVFSLDSSEPVLFCRPSIDITFKSVADVYEDKVMAILLSGANEDGAEGICHVYEKGGVTVVQDPEHAEVKTMPEAAIKLCRPDLILTNTELFELVSGIPSIKNKSR